jgi:hypothetical protein
MRMDPDEELEFEEDGNEEEEEEIADDDGGEDAKGEYGEETEGDEETEDDEGEELLTLEDEEPKKPSRSEKRVQALANSRREAEARALKAEQELEQFRAQQLTNQRGATAQQRQEYLESLSPEDRKLFLLEEGLQQQRHQIAMQEFNYQDRADKADYDVKASANPLYARFADKVEQTLKDLRKNHNLNAPREKVLHAIIGEMVVNQKVKPVAKNKAQARMVKQKAKPTNSGRSDVQSSKRGENEKAARQKRLDGYRF